VTTATLLGARIREARVAKGWTQTQLAEQMGSTKKSVGMWERTGSISPLSLGRLAQVLELNVQGQLIEQEEAPTNGYLRRFSMEVPIPTGPEAPLETLRRVRRELTRMSVELDGALEALEKLSH
jgi:transcriptional regulator with XRE-family HTH domain